MLIRAKRHGFRRFRSAKPIKRSGKVGATFNFPRFTDPSGLEQWDFHHEYPKDVMWKYGLIDFNGDTTGLVAGGNLNIHAPENGTMLQVTDHTKSGGVHAPGQTITDYNAAFEAELKQKIDPNTGKISFDDLSKVHENTKANFKAQFANGKTPTSKWRGASRWKRTRLDELLSNTANIETRYGKAGKNVLDKALKESTASAQRRVLKKLLAAIPGPAGFAVTIFFIPDKVEAKGHVGAVIDEGMDQTPGAEWVKLGYELVTGNDLILDKEDQPDTADILERFAQPPGTPEYGKYRYEMDTQGHTPRF